MKIQPNRSRSHLPELASGIPVWLTGVANSRSAKRDCAVFPMHIAYFLVLSAGAQSWAS